MASPAPTQLSDNQLTDAPAADDPGTRGSLTVHDKVVERLAARAALGTTGVRHHSGGLTKLIGRDLPRVRVQIAGDRVRAGLDVAVAWPASLPTVAAAVQRNVTDALETWAGLHVDAVDVAVLTVVTETVAQPGRSVE